MDNEADRALSIVPEYFCLLLLSASAASVKFSGCSDKEKMSLALAGDEPFSNLRVEEQNRPCIGTAVGVFGRDRVVPFYTVINMAFDNIMTFFKERLILYDASPDMKPTGPPHD